MVSRKQGRRSSPPGSTISCFGWVTKIGSTYALVLSDVDWTVLRIQRKRTTLHIFEQQKRKGKIDSLFIVEPSSPLALLQFICNWCFLLFPGFWRWQRVPCSLNLGYSYCSAVCVNQVFPPHTHYQQWATNCNKRFNILDFQQWTVISWTVLQKRMLICTIW